MNIGSAVFYRQNSSGSKERLGIIVGLLDNDRIRVRTNGCRYHIVRKDFARLMTSREMVKALLNDEEPTL